MESIGVFEARTHLSALLDRVAKGQKITITKHGIPAAMLVPVEQARPRASAGHREIVEGMRALRKQARPGLVSVRELVEEGRRF